MVSTWLNEHFAVVGSLILTTQFSIAGLLLSTDYMVVRAAPGCCSVAQQSPKQPLQRRENALRFPLE